MRRIQTPIRGDDEPTVKTDGYKSQIGYWTEGEAYELSLRDAAAFKSAVANLSQIFKEAMDVVACDDRYADYFVFTGNKRKDRKIYDLASRDWQKVKSKGYILDRWDMAYDGASSPKLLERNFGYLGLISGTASVQQDYIDWLAQQKDYAGVKPFGNLQSAFVKAFRRAADEFGIPANSRITVTVPSDDKQNDPGMVWAGEMICRWIKRAGFEPLKTPVSNLYFEDGATKATIELSHDLKQKLELEIGPKGSLIDSYATIALKQSDCFPFFGFDAYAESKALGKPAKTDEDFAKIMGVFKPEFLSSQAHMLYPYWSLLMGHKAMLPIMYERNPGHPNLLPTYFSPELLAGIKHVAKRVGGCQGIGSKIVSGAGEVVDSRRFKKTDEKFPNYIYQQYAEACHEEQGGYRVFHMFTAHDQPAALGARVAPQAFVGGDDTQTKYMPVLVRSSSKTAGVRKAPGL